MTWLGLLGRNLVYHWRGNLAVLLGVAVGTAVLTGALFVGDSLRGSLRDLTDEQLGWVDTSLVSGRFVRAELAWQLAAPAQRTGGRACAAILLQGSASTAASQTVRRSGRITVLGVDERFWNKGRADQAQTFWDGSAEEVVLNQALADELGVRAGDRISLNLQKASVIPRETWLGRRDATEVVDELRLKVHAVIPDAGPGRFSLNPTPAVPRNAFVPLRVLQAKLQQPGRANAIFLGGVGADIQARLRRALTLDDWGLVLHDPESRTRDLFAALDRDHDGRLQRNEWRRRIADAVVRLMDRNNDGVLDQAEVLAYYRQEHGYLSLESRQLLLEPAVGSAAETAAREAGLRAAPTLVYLANSITDGAGRSIPYSVVAALDPTLPPPLGPFLPAGVTALQPGEIVLVDWKESPLHPDAGVSLTMTYFEPEHEGKPGEAKTTFRFRGTVPLRGAALDPDLTPTFPGITDKLGLRDWDPPFPYDNKRVGPADERYWDEFRTTPKAYVTLADGQRLWGSRFGRLTSIRLAPTEPGTELSQAASEFRRRLLEHLDPEQGGLVFDNVRERGLAGSVGANDFRWLFLGFSCFLIAAALLLVGLLCRLNLDRRAAEVGLLVATGYRRRSVRRLLLGEGIILSALGAALGLVVAVVYARLMLRLLAALWPTTSFLTLHTDPVSFIGGYAASVVVSVLTILWAVRALGKVSPRALLAGETAEAKPAAAPRRHWAAWVGGVSVALSLVLLVAGNRTQDHEIRASSFFGSGALLLTAALATVRLWMRREHPGAQLAHGPAALTRLGVRNAARYPARSLLAAGLLASATFLIVAVESFHRDPAADFTEKTGGSGGFALLAEADVPLYKDVNRVQTPDQLDIPEQARTALGPAAIYPFRVRAGDDASCLNLYQPRRPRLLGVPHRLAERGGFRFAATEARNAVEKENPWRLLEIPRDDGAIPVFADANTAEWMLHTGLGQEWQVPNERGEMVRLRFVGLLQESIFQSELLLSEENFLKLYPRQEGYSFFLVDAPRDRLDSVKQGLETALADHGLTVTPTARRLEAYLAVENTYLSTFQALGGLGLALGALGLAVVLVRSAWERRGELALLRALGFRERALGWLVLAENGFLLLLGLAAGVVSALVAVAPHVLTGGGAVPWARLAALLAAVLFVGLVAEAGAVRSTLHAPLLDALRRE